MININYLNIDLNKARIEHYNFYACYITKKITGKNCQKSTPDLSHPGRPTFCKGYRSKDFKYKSQKDLIRNFLITEGRLEDLILGAPERIKQINDEFEKAVDSHFGTDTYKNYIDLKSGDRLKFKPKKVHDFFMDLARVIDYDTLSKDKDYNSYTLANNLGIRSCTYCNRTYTITQRKRSGKKNGRLMSPQLDHWFSQSKFPLLQISFHNLIPSCEICNSRVKNDTFFTIKDYFHPYQKDDASIKFTYRFSVLKQKYQIYFKEASDVNIKRTCKEMCIDQMYDGHGSELEDLITIKREYSEKYLESLKLSFPQARLSDELVYRLAFGTELNKKEFHKRPMSKFKYDILKELGIIKP